MDESGRNRRKEEKDVIELEENSCSVPVKLISVCLRCFQPTIQIKHGADRRRRRPKSSSLLGYKSSNRTQLSCSACLINCTDRGPEIQL